MKTVFVFLVGALVYVNAGLTPEQREKLDTIIKECKSKHDITDEDVGLLMQHKIPDSETAKCFVGCTKKGMGVLDADNKVDMKRVTEIMDLVKDKLDDKYDAIMKIFETCAAEATGDDECEVSTKLMECEIREFKEADIKVSLMHVFHSD